MFRVHQCLSRAANKKRDQCLSGHYVLNEREHGWRTQAQPLPRVTSSLWNAVCVAIMCTRHMASLHWWAVWDVIWRGQQTRQVAVHLRNSLTVVGHIPREITCTCQFFIKNKGEITGEVSGRWQCCTAACGGLEVPCLLTFYHWETRVLGKAKELVTKKLVLT